jgi:hypothetical protein
VDVWWHQFTPVGEFGTTRHHTPPTSFRRSPDFRTYSLAASKQRPRHAAAAMRRVKTHAQSFNVDCWRAGVPGSAHCSRILKEFFQSHCARGFFFRAHLNHRNLTAKRCLSVDVRADFKRKFRRREIGREKRGATQTNQARELIRTNQRFERNQTCCKIEARKIEARKIEARKSRHAKSRHAKSTQVKLTSKDSSERRHVHTCEMPSARCNDQDGAARNKRANISSSSRLRSETAQ